jgi:hypothetical protein
MYVLRKSRYVTTGGQSARLDSRHHPAATPSRFLFLSVICCFNDPGLLSLTRGLVCSLELLLDLASIGILNSRRTRDRILLSQILGSPTWWERSPPPRNPMTVSRNSICRSGASCGSVGVWRPLCLQVTLNLAIADFLGIEFRGTQDHIALHQISDSLDLEDQVPHLLAKEQRREILDTGIQSYLTGNTSHLRYRAQPVNAVWGNSRCVL